MAGCDVSRGKCSRKELEIKIKLHQRLRTKVFEKNWSDEPLASKLEHNPFV